MSFVFFYRLLVAYSCIFWCLLVYFGVFWRLLGIRTDRWSIAAYSVDSLVLIDSRQVWLVTLDNQLAPYLSGTSWLMGRIGSGEN